ncbi:uncharacterized protein LOC143290282 [Babylonia areolata]|uniref:uncharacterized protein LOC143290282 n=1 Tax=Babylonia areolata TaxID=304850 RepID=UPI003FD47686
MCSSTILIPDPKQPKHNWARQFDTDPFLTNLREAVLQLEGKRLCFVCSSRNAKVDACNYCFDCATYFCNPCTESHRHMPNQKNHRVKKVDDISAGELMKTKKRFCRTHEGVTLDLFCNDHKTAMCQECAISVHQNCGSITTVAKLATEKKEKLKTAEKVLEVGLSKCEHNTKRIQAETAEIEQIKQQTKKEIESSFDQVIEALQSRKSKLQRDIDDHFSQDQPEIANTKKRQENLMSSMKAKTEFLQQLMQHASDFDILQCADSFFTSAESITSQNATLVETPRPKVVVKIDDKAVKNFVELVSILGAEAGSTQVKGILLKKITTRLKGDQFTPDIRDIFLADVGHIVAVDNKNTCVKSIQINGESFITKRLELNSEPWGGTKLQQSMIAVTGLKVIYIITLSDGLSLQSAVKTRKDYWGVCAISPINLACSCKYPPGVDIVDITGRRLRSIEEDHLGNQLFEMPTYLVMNGDNIVVTDRAKKKVICVDQEGKVIFMYRGQGGEGLEYPRGICVDQQGRIFVADHDRGCVELLSKQGDYLCQVMAAPKPRTLSLDNNDKTLYVSTEGKGLTFFNLIEVQT